MRNYDVMFENQAIGKVTVEKEGLYFRFSCECQLYQPGLYRLIAACQGREVPIGILTPGNGGFVLNTRIATKKFITQPTKFNIIPCKEERKERFIPLCADAPFAYISDLPGAKLFCKNGQTGILISSD